MLWFFVAAAALLAALGALYWRWNRRVEADIAEGAAIEWDYFQKNEPAFVDGMTAEQFHAVYRSVHKPRFPAYALGAFATFIISLPAS
ncbi:MAG: hypothetical protein ACX939_08275, partial [Hyphococcus sp.]